MKRILLLLAACCVLGVTAFADVGQASLIQAKHRDRHHHTRHHAHRAAKHHAHRRHNTV